MTTFKEATSKSNTSVYTLLDVLYFCFEIQKLVNYYGLWKSSTLVITSSSQN